MEILNNREWAIVIWLLIVACSFIILPSMKEIRKSFYNLIINFFKPKIFIPIFLMLIYVFLIIFLLWKLNIWDISSLKNTLIWTFSVGFLSFLQLASNKAKQRLFINIIFDYFKLTAIIQFVLGIHTFSLIAELFIAPCTFVLSWLALSPSHRGNGSPHKNIFHYILVLIGIVWIIYAVYKIALDFELTAYLATIYDYLTPPALTLLYLPFLYIFYIIITYESIFLRIRLSISEPDILRYAKIMSIFYFRFNLKLLSRWADELNFQDINSKKSAKTSIQRLFTLVKREKDPPKVRAEEGWSPYTAKDFLVDDGIETGYYHSFGDGEWGASSPMIQLNDGIIPNNIAYYVDGDEVKATKLSILLNINTHDTKDEAHQKLLSCSKTILKKALGLELSDKMEEALLNGENQSLMFGNFNINTKRNQWSNKGYDIKFSVERAYTK